MSSDNTLQREVIDELGEELSANAAHIRVAAKDGVVTLTGDVPSHTEKFRAEHAANRVYGVEAVADELDVKLPCASERTDEGIARACLGILSSNASVPRKKIKVIVSDGWVTLEGEVETPSQREAAIEAVRCVAGLMGVIDELGMKEGVPTGDGLGDA